MKMKPSKEDVQGAIQDVDALNLPEGAHWAYVHDVLNLEYGEVFDLLLEYNLIDTCEDK
jgi:hypothetical protein